MTPANSLSRILQKTQPRWVIPGSLVMTAVAVLILVFADHGRTDHGKFWQWDAPAMFIGSFFNGVVYTSVK